MDAGRGRSRSGACGAQAFAEPSRLGDFLTGLFGLAREATQRQIGLILGIDELIAGYSAETFLEALPSLRLAFT